MANAFLGGVASSLAGTLNANRERKAAKEDWEWKAQKTAELEEKLRANRVTQTKVYKGDDGQYYVQGYNDAGQEVGQPRPAGPAQVENANREKNTYELGVKKLNAEIAESEGKLANDRERIGIDRDRAANERRRTDLEAQQVDYMRDDAAARGLLTDAQRKAMEEEARREQEGWNLLSPEEKKLRAMYGQNPPRPTAGGSDGPSGKGAGGDGTIDVERTNKLIKEISETAADPAMADQLREEIAELRSRGRTEAQIMQFLSEQKREAEAAAASDPAAGSVTNSLRNSRIRAGHE
jgi:hypothetical protein